MKQTDRMKEWRQTIVVICTVVLTIAALAAYMQFELAGIRADMNAQSEAIRADMNAQNAAMRADMNAQHAAIRADMNAQFAAMHAEHATFREQLNSMDRRTARIEGHLFGIEIPVDPADGE